MAANQAAKQERMASFEQIKRQKDLKLKEQRETERMADEQMKRVIAEKKAQAKKKAIAEKKALAEKTIAEAKARGRARAIAELQTKEAEEQAYKKQAEEEQRRAAEKAAAEQRRKEEYAKMMAEYKEKETPKVVTDAAAPLAEPMVTVTSEEKGMAHSYPKRDFKPEQPKTEETVTLKTSGEIHDGTGRVADTAVLAGMGLAMTASIVLMMA